MKQPDKSERCLKLHEQGLMPAQIAERLGTTARSVSVMIIRAKVRRQKMAGAATARSDELARVG